MFYSNETWCIRLSSARLSNPKRAYSGYYLPLNLLDPVGEYRYFAVLCFCWC